MTAKHRTVFVRVSVRRPWAPDETFWAETEISLHDLQTLTSAEAATRYLQPSWARVVQDVIRDERKDKP